MITSTANDSLKRILVSSFEVSDATRRVEIIDTISRDVAFEDTSYNGRARDIRVCDFAGVLEKDYNRLIDITSQGLEDSDFEVRKASIRALTYDRREVIKGESNGVFQSELMIGRLNMLFRYLGTEYGHTDGMATSIMSYAIGQLAREKDFDALAIFNVDTIEVVAGYLFSEDEFEENVALNFLKLAHSKLSKAGQTYIEKRLGDLVENAETSSRLSDATKESILSFLEEGQA